MRGAGSWARCPATSSERSARASGRGGTANRYREAKRGGPVRRNLHDKAGTHELIEIHGTIGHSSCPACGSRYALPDVRDRCDRDPAGVPRCVCGAPLKPDVVLFGELLSADALARAEDLAAGADLLLCIGSSLEVYPVAQLPATTLAGGGSIAVMTLGATPYDSRAAIRCGGDVVAELTAVTVALGLG